MLAVGVNVAQWYISKVEIESISTRAEKSIQEQILDELRKDQLLEDLKKKGK